MKHLIKISFVIIIAILAINSASGQNNDVFIIVKNTNNKTITVLDNEEKKMEFEIGGIGSKEQLEEYINEIRKMRGVVSVTVSDEPIDLKWQTTVVFYKYAYKRYFTNYFFIRCKLKYLMINNITYSSPINFSEIDI